MTWGAETLPGEASPRYTARAGCGSCALLRPGQAHRPLSS
jgi:hypothetical protein